MRAWQEKVILANLRHAATRAGIYKTLLDLEAYVAGSWPAYVIFKTLGVPINGAPDDLDVWIRYTKTDETNDGNSYLVDTSDKNASYDIMNVTRIGFINYIEYRPKSKYSAYGFELFDLVNSFDINAIQAGWEPLTNKLYITYEFTGFMENQILFCTDAHSPASTCLRFVDKAKRMGCKANYADFMKLVRQAVEENNVAAMNAKKLAVYNGSATLQKFFKIVDADNYGSKAMVPRNPKSVELGEAI